MKHKPCSVCGNPAGWCVCPGGGNEPANIAPTREQEDAAVRAQAFKEAAEIVRGFQEDGWGDHNAILEAAAKAIEKMEEANGRSI